jgi:hypothetical protein
MASALAASIIVGIKLFIAGHGKKRFFDDTDNSAVVNRLITVFNDILTSVAGGQS